MGLFNRKAAFACMERFSGMGELASCDDVTICCVDELARRCPDFLQLPIAACIGIGTDDFEKEKLKAGEINSRIGYFEKYKLLIKKTYKQDEYVN